MHIEEVFNGKCSVVNSKDDYNIEVISLSKYYLDKLSSFINKQPRGKEEQEIAFEFILIEKKAINNFNLHIEWELEGRIRKNGEDYIGKIKFVTINNKYEIINSIDENGYIGIRLNDALLKSDTINIELDISDE